MPKLTRFYVRWGSLILENFNKFTTLQILDFAVSLHFPTTDRKREYIILQILSALLGDLQVPRSKTSTLMP